MKPRIVTEHVRSRGVVLKTMPYSDTDMMLHIFLRERGKTSFIAKRMRSQSSRSGPKTDLFDLAEFEGSIGHGEIFRLEAVHSRQILASLREDLDKYVVASVTVEVFDALVKEGTGDSEDLYELLTLALRAYHEAIELKQLLRSCFLSVHQLMKCCGILNPNLDASPSAKHLGELLQAVSEHSGKELLSLSALELIMQKLR